VTKLRRSFLIYLAVGVVLAFAAWQFLDTSPARTQVPLDRYEARLTEGKVATDPLLIVDGQHYLHRFHFEQPRAALGILQPEQTQPLAARFAEIWATGESGINATVLGL